MTNFGILPSRLSAIPSQLLLFVVLSASSWAESLPDEATKQTTRLASVNRTVPNVEPPKTVLKLSARPTVQEIFRAGVFEEPLVPIGGEPTLVENADLSAALNAYA